jgi:hypothetical protein
MLTRHHSRGRERRALALGARVTRELGAKGAIQCLTFDADIRIGAKG